MTRQAKSCARSVRGCVLAFAIGFAVSLGGCSVPAQEGGGPDLAVILAQSPAPKLADYGLFLDAAATEPAARVLGYDLINPLFSDHATKTRLVFVPEGARAQYVETDVLSLPVGSVLIKSFGYAQTGRIETRLLIHKASGWVGYPYVWNDDQTEAHYAPIGAKRDVEITSPLGEVLSFQYAVPNQNQCKTCHQAGDDITPIGPKARNLGSDQIALWSGVGLLSGAPQDIAEMPSIAVSQGTLDARARAYLDINCAHCHKSDGAASNSGLWLGWEEESAVKLGIGKHPTAAGRGAGALSRVIEPGQPGQSILSFRMASAEAGVAMPELGRRIVDKEGLDLINQWIGELPND
jgi:uncharacterized repeat protein (TIGR03806 family)